MSSKSLSETKRKLRTTHERMNGAFSMLVDAMPAHPNVVDAPLTSEIQEVQTELRSLMARTVKLYDKIG